MGLFNWFSGDERRVCSCERCRCTCGGCHCCSCGVEQQVSRPPSFWGGLWSFWTSTAPDEDLGQDYAPVYYQPTYQPRPQPRYAERGCSLPGTEPDLPEFGQEIVPYSVPQFDHPGDFGLGGPGGFVFEMPAIEFPEFPFGE